MNLQWTIDSVTTLSFRPDMSFSTNDSRSESTNASFNVDPFEYVTDPLSYESRQRMDDMGLIVNGRENKSMSYGSNTNINSQIQLYRRFGRNGRNMTINGRFNYRDGDNQNASLSRVILYQQPDRFGNDSTYQTNRYTLSPSDNWGYQIGFSYTEPLFIFKPKPQPEDTTQTNRFGFGNFGGGRGGNRGGGGGGGRGGRVGQQGIFLQVNYRYNYSYQKSDPSTYDFPELSSDAFLDVLRDYRDFTRLFGYLDNPYESYLSDDLSRYSTKQFHVGAGYSYNWVVLHQDPRDGRSWKGLQNLTVNLTALPMISLSNNIYTERGFGRVPVRTRHAGHTAFSPTLRAGVCYAWDRYYVTVQAHYNRFGFRGANSVIVEDDGESRTVNTRGVFYDLTAKVQLNVRF